MYCAAETEINASQTDWADFIRCCTKREGILQPGITQMEESGTGVVGRRLESRVGYRERISKSRRWD